MGNLPKSGYSGTAVLHLGDRKRPTKSATCESSGSARDSARNDKSGLENLNDLAALIRRPAEKDYGAAIGSRRDGVISTTSLSTSGPDSNNSKPVGNDRNEAEGRKEVSGELVIARGDAAEILQPSEAARDDVAVLVGALVVPDALLAAGFAGDDRLDFLVARIAPVSPPPCISDSL